MERSLKIQARFVELRTALQVHISNTYSILAERHSFENNVDQKVSKRQNEQQDEKGERSWARRESDNEPSRFETKICIFGRGFSGRCHFAVCSIRSTILFEILSPRKKRCCAKSGTADSVKWPSIMLFKRETSAKDKKNSEREAEVTFSNRFNRLTRMEEGIYNFKFENDELLKFLTFCSILIFKVQQLRERKIVQQVWHAGGCIFGLQIIVDSSLGREENVSK